MAFMALFGWIFIPVILLYFLLSLIAAPVVWAQTHPGLVNAVAVGLLIFNALLFLALIRWRRRRKREGKAKSLVTLLAVLWEGWVVLLCALYLIVQPLRFLPAGFMEPFSLENNCYGVWTIAACQGKTPGCTQSQEEIDAFLGRQIAYGEGRFISTDWAYPLEGEDSYSADMIRRERFLSLYSLSLEALNIDRGCLNHVSVTLPEGTEADQPLGRELYVLDKNTLLLHRKGVFYRAERTEQPVPGREDRPIPPKIRDLSAPPYFAAWTVTDCLGTSPEAPMDPEMIEKILGTELEYRAESVRFDRDGVGGGGFRDPSYQETELTPEAFRSTYGVSLEDLGMEPDTCLCVTIDVDCGAGLESLRNFLRSLGSRFLLPDEETMLLCAEGAFFRAELVPDSRPMIFDPDFELPLPDG